MTVKSCEKLEKSRVALTIETSAEEFEAAVNKAYLKMRGKINVPGFRVGKAPRKIIEKMYGAEVFYEEAVNILQKNFHRNFFVGIITGKIHTHQRYKLNLRMQSQKLTQSAFVLFFRFNYVQ